MIPSQVLNQHSAREVVEYDVVIVGAGPSGLAAAIRLKQLGLERGRDVSVVVLEKGSEPGAHIVSGAVIDPVALAELLPHWKELGAPLRQPVTRDEVLFLSERGFFRTPGPVMPDNLRNEGNYVASLGSLVRWLADQAERLGVEIFPGFAANELLYDAEGRVMGVATGAMGVGKDGMPTKQFQLGMALHAKYTLLAEGARGQLGKKAIAKFALDAASDPPGFALGIKEAWEVPASQAQPGLVIHTAGWPLKSDTYGGGFLYHLDDRKVVLGFIVGLNYSNPRLSPFEELQRWKTHPAIRGHLEGGQRIGYGARAINASGLLSLPKTIFPGGALMGCDAGFLNGPRIKGSHTAIKSGMLAAEAAFEALSAGRSWDELTTYPQAVAGSWLYRELHQARNWKQWFRWGLWGGIAGTVLEYWLLPRLGIASAPWTLRRTTRDHENLKPAEQCEPIAYPRPDGRLTFDRLSSVFLSNTNHEENQPPHLQLKNASVPVDVNLKRYAGPESRYCPAGVYEFLKGDDGSDRLQINAQNCVHCKTCDIKDPTQNIVWVAPEGGGGPNYAGM